MFRDLLGSSNFKSAICAFLLCCSYILVELVETERDYVRDLGLVVEVSQHFIRAGTDYLICSTVLGVLFYSVK